MGPLMLDVAGYELSQDDKEILEHPLVGGVILFTRNYHDPKQLTELNRNIRQYCRNDVLIATDHEGGRVQRFRQDFTPLPAAGDIFKLATGDIEQARKLAQKVAWIMAAELLACQVDFSFAPVVDVDGVSDVIGNRAFHQSPEVVTLIAQSFIKGAWDAGMANVVKHFPGHGSVQEDTHIAVAVDKRSAEEIQSLDMRAFTDTMAHCKVSAVMPAHVIYPNVDKKHPACFSNVWLRNILRNQLDFDGVIFSDDLSMKGAEYLGNMAERAKCALHAGCDMVLVCNDRKGAEQVLDGLPVDYKASHRLPTMSGRFESDFDELRNSWKWSDTRSFLEQFC